jgi:hypothetical protein
MISQVAKKLDKTQTIGRQQLSKIQQVNKQEIGGARMYAIAFDMDIESLKVKLQKFCKGKVSLGNKAVFILAIQTLLMLLRVYLLQLIYLKISHGLRLQLKIFVC